MTSLCKCCTVCCSKCVNCFFCICRFLFLDWSTIACIGCCCYLLGMAAMLLIIYLYYSVAVYQGSAEPNVTVYEYEQAYPIYKRESEYQTEESYVHVQDNDYYGETGIHGDYDEIGRNRRDDQTPTPASSSTSGSLDTKKMNNSTQTPSVKKTDSKIGSNSSNAKEPSELELEEELDFKLSNNFVDFVQAEAEKNKMKEPLGLCRRVENFSTPDMNATLFPLEQAQDIISCINTILRNQTKKHLCIELNQEMSAFLEWLILTGESKERRKHVKVKAFHNDFLFPSTCGEKMPNMEMLTRSPMAPAQPPGPGVPPGGPGVPPGGPEVPPVGPVPLGPPVANLPIVTAEGVDVLTTCGPVESRGKSKKKKS